MLIHGPRFFGYMCVCVCIREMERENVLAQKQYDLTIACLQISYHLCSLCSTFLHKQVQNIASYLSVDLVRKISQFIVCYNILCVY